MSTKLAEEDWDFTDADIHYMTHGLHPYPARMIPQIASRLIARYSEPGDFVLDPFCGSGGVLVESILSGRNAAGIDINPLACLLARVKTTPIDPTALLAEWDKLRQQIDRDIFAFRFEGKQLETPDFRDVNIDYWFKPYMIQELAAIKKHIEKIEDQRIKEFFQVCFSYVIRQVSGLRKGEFKIYRMPKLEWDKYNPDVWRVFRDRVAYAISKMGEFFQAMRKSGRQTKVWVFEADTRNLLTDKFPPEGRKVLSEESVDLIVTSPPYGDSHTTVAYGQFSRFSLLWLGYSKEKVLEIDKVSIGGKNNGITLLSNKLREILPNIKDEKRQQEVSAFFADLGECFMKLERVLKRGGYACFVLGNRTVGGIKIPTDMILAELGERTGFVVEAVFHRRIPSKRIPWKSSPTNIPGKGIVETIGRESIIVLKKS